MVTVSRTGALLGGTRVYLLATRRHSRLPLLDAVAAACAAGAGAVQVREKDLPDAEFLALARDLRAVTREAGALLIVNDRVHLAAACDADGVHVGPGDMEPGAARAVIGPAGLLGVTTHDLQQARRAAGAGADYVGIGPVHPTATKGAPLRAIGPEAAGEVTRALAVPAFAIGGVTPANAPRAARAGCRRFAVCAAVLGAEDPGAVVRSLLDALAGAGLPAIPRHEGLAVEEA